MFFALMESFVEVKKLLDSVSGRKTAEGFLLVLCALITALFITVFTLQRDRFLRLSAMARIGRRERHSRRSAEVYFPPALPAPKEEAREEIIIPKSVFDAERADSLISDKMAKNLIHKTEVVKTFGKKRTLVNIGELSRAFSDGERVDINRMKAVGLIPYDAFEVKVLAAGTLDKKLFVYANGFSKTAVKMIALSGGEALKVRSLRVKMPRF